MRIETIQVLDIPCQMPFIGKSCGVPCQMPFLDKSCDIFTKLSGAKTHLLSILEGIEPSSLWQGICAYLVEAEDSFSPQEVAASDAICELFRKHLYTSFLPSHCLKFAYLNGAISGLQKANLQHSYDFALQVRTAWLRRQIEILHEI